MAMTCDKCGIVCFDTLYHVCIGEGDLIEAKLSVIDAQKRVKEIEAELNRQAMWRGKQAVIKYLKK